MYNILSLVSSDEINTTSNPFLSAAAPGPPTVIDSDGDSDRETVSAPAKRRRQAALIEEDEDE